MITSTLRLALVSGLGLATLLVGPCSTLGRVCDFLMVMIAALSASRRIFVDHASILPVPCDILISERTARRLQESVNRFRLSYRKEDPCDVVA
jgi:hypothetical protein